MAAFKWINNGPPIDDPPRAASVLDAVGADATAHGVDPTFVRTVDPLYRQALSSATRSYCPTT